MKICSLASGSSGNCIYVSGGNTEILIDAGVSGKKIVEALTSIGTDITNIKAVLVTHEHSDHIQSIGVLARKYKIPLYGTTGTFAAARCGKVNIGEIKREMVNYVEYDRDFIIGDMLIHPFKISHDAAEPCAYTFCCNGQKIGFATDLGFVDERIFDRLKDSDALYLESNHDVHMLEVGPYPYVLKQRIKGDRGHLSNEHCAETVVRLCNEGIKKLQHVILGHLSEENNIPELAEATVSAEVFLHVKEDRRPVLSVAPRHIPSEIAEV